MLCTFPLSERGAPGGSTSNEDASSPNRIPGTDPKPDRWRFLGRRDGTHGQESRRLVTSR